MLSRFSGFALAAAFYSMVVAFPIPMMQRYFLGHPIAVVTTVLFCVALAQLAFRFLDILQSKRQFSAVADRDLLPESRAPARFVLLLPVLARLLAVDRGMVLMRLGAIGLGRRFRRIIDHDLVHPRLAAADRAACDLEHIHDDGVVWASQLQELAALHHTARGLRLPRAAHLTVGALVDADAARLRRDPVRPRHEQRIVGVRDVRALAAAAALVRLFAVFVA